MNIQSGIMRFDATKFLLGSDSRNYFPGQCLNSAPRARHHKYPGHLTLRYRSNSLLSVGLASERRCTRLHDMSNTCRRSRLQRFYCSKSDGQDGEHKESTTESNAQAPPGEQDQTESKNRKSPLSTRGAKFRDEFVRRIVPWEEIPVSLDTLPYYIHDRTKNLLVECMASHLKQKEFRKYGGRLACSSNRILLQSIPGTRLYRERLVSALAREFQVPLLKLDSSILPPYNFSEDYNEGETDEESSGSVLDLFADDTTDEEEDTCSNEETTDDSDEEVDNQTTDCASIGSANSSSSSKSDVCLLKEGDRVEYVGPTIAIKEANNRILSSGQRGEVHEVNGDEVAVIFNICGMGKKEAEKDDKNTETAAPATLTWFNVKDIEHDRDAQTHDCHIAMEVLYEVLESHQPIVAYFPDSFCLLSRRASYRTREEFVRRVKKIFAQFSGRVVLICAQDEWNAGSEVMEKFPVSLKQYIKRLKARPAYEEDHICRPFTNVIYIKPPKDQDQLNTFIKQLEEDRTTVISEGNLSEMHKVLKEHGLSCMDLKRANSNDVILTRGKAEKVVSWATNHYLSSCPLPCVEEDRLHMSHESIKLAISRLKEQETEFKKPIKDLASGRYERRLVSAVVSPSDIGVKFDDVGALEDVKKVLYELVILPMRRPELFSHGNLLRPCKGMLLFGPPGNGKTLLAKALATEAGANFINITTSSITSMWLGESEKLTRALFSYASKLAPVIIFVDEADSLLGARGRNKYDDARLNEFMAAWDGLRSKESQRILVLGATNRPFDMDDAVIRRMPRRIYVGLPDVENRSKILQVLLAKENLEPGFSFEKLAEATEGYSGSDLKNLCVAAAYRPVQELLEEESKGKRTDGVPAIRPLNLDDLIHSKAKVAPSVAHNTSSMNELSKWNEQFGEGGSRRK